jgi:V/A-type H+-transporting ATPase subunit E
VSAESIEMEAQLIEKIVEKRNTIIAIAEKKSKEMLESAEEEVAKIKAESEKQVVSLMGSELRAVNDRILGGAELEGRKMLMMTRQNLLSEVFNETESRLDKMAEDMGSDYTVILRKMISESVSAIGGEEFIVSANKRDLEYLKENLRTINKDLNENFNSSIELNDEPIDIKGGVVVRNTDATKTYYNTLKGKLDNVRSRIEAEVAEILGVI